MTLVRRLALLRIARWAALALLAAAGSGTAPASEMDERRTRISLEIFPRIVAVDQELRDKLSETAKVRLVVIYDRDAVAAHRVVDSLRATITNIGGREVEVIAQSMESVVRGGVSRPSALFLAEQIDDKLFTRLLQLATVHHVLLFSPFAGDVERGATVGIAISSRIRPYFNVPTLNRSKISVNEKLLSISQRYE
jgi:hypothetical protein